MIVELGNLALMLALVLAGLLAVLPMLGAQRNQPALMRLARPLTAMHTVMIVLAWLALTWAFIQKDFSVLYVAKNANSLLPLHYRISAVWGAHEGSLLLWVMILGLWMLAVAMFSRKLPQAFASRVMAVLGFISAGFLSFTLFTSNPFERLLPAAPEGMDLNPLLQDIGLIMHPPMLYVGYVGFAVAFAFAVASLIEGKVDRDTVRWTRPWTLVAWAFLTLGIALGSWWAYYELGWGGWWFWDPVENASFMPWLVGTALIHSQLVTEKRGSFPSWTLLLAISAFALSLLGTFLVRSGVLTSVHSFAADPERGMYILGFLAIVIGGSLLLYGLRAPKVDRGEPFALWSKETLMLSGNVLFTSSAAMVLIGTLYPLAMSALNLGKISVGPPYFGTLFIVLMVPVVLMMPFAPLTRWRQEQSASLKAWLPITAIVALLLGAVMMWLQGDWVWKAAIGWVAGLWIMIGLVFVWKRRIKMAPKGRRLTAESLAMTLAHVGVAVFVIGVFMVEATSVEKDLAMSPGQSQTMHGYTFVFDGVDERRGPNYFADHGVIQVQKDGRHVATLEPQKRRYASGGQIMTEAAIDPGFTRDLYVALGKPLSADQSRTGSWAVRVYVKPYIRWIWLGALMMMLGGFIGAFDRRFRSQPQQVGS